MKEKKTWTPKKTLKLWEHFHAPTFRITGEKNWERLFEANELYQNGDDVHDIWDAFNENNIGKLTKSNFEKLCEYYEWFYNQGGHLDPKENI